MVSLRSFAPIRSLASLQRLQRLGHGWKVGPAERVAVEVDQVPRILSIVSYAQGCPCRRGRSAQQPAGDLRAHAALFSRLAYGSKQASAAQRHRKWPS